MFKKRVIDWELNKNYKSAEREAVARVVERCKSRGDPIPPILLHGQPVKMHRIQRHCNIGQSVTGPFGSARSIDSSDLANHNGRAQPGGLAAGYNKETHLTDEMRMTADNLQKLVAQFAIPLRQLSPPHELKHVEFVILQTNTYYEWFAQSQITRQMEDNTALVSQSKVRAPMPDSLSAFVCKISAAWSSLRSSRLRAGWRLLDEAMDMIKPIFASKSPYNLEILLRLAWELGKSLGPDFYRVMWGQISEMASIVLGESDPLSKVCHAITQIESKGHVYNIVVRLMRSIFERTLGPDNDLTRLAKARHVTSLLANGDFTGAECLQRTLLSDSKALGNEAIRRQAVGIFRLGFILELRRDFIGAKKLYRDSLHLSRVAGGERFPTEADIFRIAKLVSVLTEDEYDEGEVLLQEALEKCLKYENWGRYDWQTVFVLGSLENLLKKQRKFHEAEMLRLQHPDAF